VDHALRTALSVYLIAKHHEHNGGAQNMGLFYFFFCGEGAVRNSGTAQQPYDFHTFPSPA
jgi:hypothetical protein